MSDLSEDWIATRFKIGAVQGTQARLPVLLFERA
jgi:hypothetical protein